jgi:tRNA pseudouridine13 synthase
MHLSGCLLITFKSCFLFIPFPVFQVSEDKSVRTAVHQLIKQDFPNLESSTTMKDDQRIITVCKRKVPRKDHGRGWWPSTRGDYTHFLLYKENKDTADAIGLLAKFLNVKSSYFTYAGNKDRRAITVQQMSVYRVMAEKLSQLNKNLRDIRVGNFRYEKEPLRLGQLWGNRFTILLRYYKTNCY